MAERSAPYPRATWNDCLEFARTVSSFNLKAVSAFDVAQKYGINNVGAKSFSSKLSTSKQFGLITTSGRDTIHLTETCKRILFPTGEDTNAIARACFGMPPLYTKLIAAYDGKAVPSKELLANILMNDHRIQKSVKDQAAQIFLDSARQLGLIKGGILCYSDPGEEPAPSSAQEPAPEEAPAAPQEQVPPVPVSPVQTAAAVSDEADYITQSIPFASGKIARFIIPVDATEDDLLLLHDMLDVLLKRKFKLVVE